MSSCRTAAVILAAGASTRLGGSPKVLLPFAGLTIIETVLAKASEAGLGPLVVVVGGEGDAVERKLARSATVPVRVIVNPRSAQGIAGSVAAGVGAVKTDDVDSAAILLADEPGVDVASIRYVVGEWRRVRPAATRALYTDRPGHPVVLSQSVFSLVSGLLPSVSVLPELAQAGAEIGSVAIDARAPIDVDTWEDYERALRRWPPSPSVPVGTTPGAAAPRGSPHR